MTRRPKWTATSSPLSARATTAPPAGLGALAPKVFAVGLFTCGLNTLVVVSQLMCYFCLDAFRQDWHYTRENRGFRWLLVFWVGVPAVLTTFWNFPALLKMVLLMGLNIVIVPMAIVIMIYLINKPSLMREHRANAWRNLFLVGSLCLALWLAASKAPGYFQGAVKQLRGSQAQQAALVDPYCAGLTSAAAAPQYASSDIPESHF